METAHHYDPPLSPPKAILGLGPTPSLLAHTTQPCTYLSGKKRGAPIPPIPAIRRPSCGQKWVPGHLNQTLTGGPEEHREGGRPTGRSPACQIVAWLTRAPFLSASSLRSACRPCPFGNNHREAFLTGALSCSEDEVALRYDDGINWIFIVV
jgi:hypothetical protein